MTCMPARIDGCRCWLAGMDPDVLTRHLSDLLIAAGFTIVGQAEHHFEPHGYTRLWLLAESHLALHTFPEAELSYIELASCNTRMYEAFVAGLPALGEPLSPEAGSSAAERPGGAPIPGPMARRAPT